MGKKKFIKYNKGKVKYTLIPPEVIEELLKVLHYGANKYGENNWQLVPDKDIYVDALYRHLEAYRSGKEIYDTESGMMHISHALANAAFLVYLERSVNDTIRSRQ